MHCDNENKINMVTATEAKIFLSKINYDYIYESAEEMKSSYIIIDSKGNISTDNLHSSKISIFDYELNDAINMLNINYQNYIKRYVLNEWYFI